jgi:hypothetical protein
MEGTSGAADLERLRGRSSEAALGPRVAGPAQAGPASVPVGPAHRASRMICANGSSRSATPPRRPAGPAKAGRAGGYVSPTHSRSRVSAGFARWDRWRRTVRARFGLVPWRTATGAARARLSIWRAAVSRHEVSERIGLGRSSRRGCVSRTRHRAQQRMRLVRVRRQTGGAGRRKPAGPWPVRPRLVKHDVSDGASAPFDSASGPQGSGRERRAAPPGSSSRHGGWLQPHPEGSSQFSASWARRVDEPGAGIGRSCGCARGLKLVAEVDERHLVQLANATGNRREKRWV